jgi:hypothetical protein
MMPKEVEQKAISVSKQYLESRGYSIEDVSRKRAHHGYDFIVRRRQENLKVEVKGCTRMWRIPDLYVSEFDKEKRLIADFLCVVYFIELEKPKVCMIPRDSIKPEYVKRLSRYRISSVFTKESVLRPFLNDRPAAPNSATPKRPSAS